MKNVGPAAANSGALTVDQAVARLNDAPKKKNTGEADDTALDEGDMPPGGGDGALRQAQGEESGDDEADDGESEQAELEPPKFWDAKAKERFGELPRDLQKTILDKENARNQATAKALQESAERRKAADAEASRYKSVSDGFDKLLPHAFAAFDHRWSHVNWNNVTQQLGADATMKLQNQMQAERDGLQRLSAAKEAAELLSHKRFVQDQEALMPEHAPVYAHDADVEREAHRVCPAGYMKLSIDDMQGPAERGRTLIWRISCRGNSK